MFSVSYFDLSKRNKSEYFKSHKYIVIFFFQLTFFSLNILTKSQRIL